MVKLLDFGYIKLIETWGSDERIIEAARMSTDAGFRGWGPKPCDVPGCEGNGTFYGEDMQLECPKCKGSGHIPGDEKLLRYLWEHKHHTPFEMAGAIFEIQAPIFVFREWQRHRTQSYNELSARYTPIPDCNYAPTLERIYANVASKNKQAQGLGSTDPRRIQRWLDKLPGIYKTVQDFYQEGLDIGIPKELARLVIPVGRYSRMRASANLRNWLAFLTLRNDPAAQWEIQVYAAALQNILKEHFPRTLELFEETKAAA